MSVASNAAVERRRVESESAIAFPVSVGGEVIAVLYAEVDDALSPQRRMSKDALDTLTRHAGRVLETITVQQAAGLRPLRRESTASRLRTFNGRAVVVKQALAVLALATLCATGMPCPGPSAFARCASARPRRSPQAAATHRRPRIRRFRHSDPSTGSSPTRPSRRQRRGVMPRSSAWPAAWSSSPHGDFAAGAAARQPARPRWHAPRTVRALLHGRGAGRVGARRRSRRHAEGARAVKARRRAEGDGDAAARLGCGQARRAGTRRRPPRRSERRENGLARGRARRTRPCRGNDSDTRSTPCRPIAASTTTIR